MSSIHEKKKKNTRKNKTFTFIYIYTQMHIFTVKSATEHMNCFMLVEGCPQ